jgi:hypothetical protein
LGLILTIERFLKCLSASLSRLSPRHCLHNPGCSENKRLKSPLVKNMTGCSPNIQLEIQASAEEFVQQMRSSQGEVIDLSYWSFFWSFDLTFDLIFGSRFGYMRQRRDCNTWIYTFKTIMSGAAVLDQIPEWCEWTLASDSSMNFMRRFQSFPDPTQGIIQEIEQQISNHDSVSHDCSRSFMYKILAARREKFNITEHTEVVSILFETVCVSTDFNWAGLTSAALPRQPKSWLP